MNSWILKNNDFKPEMHLHNAPVNTVGNGLVCARGFLEEQQTGIAGLGGIYMARVFGKAGYKAWDGSAGNEIVNVPNFFWARIKVNGALIEPLTTPIEDFETQLDIEHSSLLRKCTYIIDGKKALQCEFSRFISTDNINAAGQKIKLTALVDNLVIDLECGTNTDITNLNDVSCEPYPVQPGKRQYEPFLQSENIAAVEIKAPERILLAFGQKINADNAKKINSDKNQHFSIELKSGESAKIEKVIALALSLEDGDDVVEIVKKRLDSLPSYDELYEAHAKAMTQRWSTADIIIEGNVDDQRIIRYNMLQLMQSCPSHTGLYSIGARGLTGEMYEGSVFWDTEIFMLPFFTLTDPKAARKLLEFRYNTLPQARQHAANNWFKGAMYGWQVNAKGKEQTPVGVGAYYSIHVIADIAYAILDYWHVTGDEDFMLNGGLEILMETARFWASRSTKRDDGLYDIMAVRGPNEYDVIVNNNLYTNMMARENFFLCEEMINAFGSTHKAEMDALCQKLEFDTAEFDNWHEIAQNYVLPYDEKNDLWLEDDTYLRRAALDMAKAKPTSKRIIDTTIPYEALPFYRVTKQADVLHVMRNLPWHFTKQQTLNAFDFYKPKTAFDSSLAYSMFALIAARLGKTDEAEHYYDLTANMDIRNIQLNTISGLHFANFGGTWQAVVFGFAGVTIEKDGVSLTPHLPNKWKSLEFKLIINKAHLQFNVKNNCATVKLCAAGAKAINVTLGGTKFVLTNANDVAQIDL